jgi:hypothetical protein
MRQPLRVDTLGRGAGRLEAELISVSADHRKTFQGGRAYE